LAISSNSTTCTSVAGALNERQNLAVAKFLPVRYGDTEHPGNRTAIAFAGLLIAGFAGWRSRKLRLAISLTVLFALGTTISGCGSGISKIITQTSTTHTVTITGTDTATSSIAASTTVTLTIN